MLRVGITGQAGFIGWHLYHTLLLLKDEFLLVDFDKSFFDNDVLMDDFVRSCDVIVHLAAKNRDKDELVVYNVNLDLSRKLISSFNRTGARPRVIFSSSTQEVLNNLYGKSKSQARQLLESWARDVGGSFTGLVIPNVFGPFSKPFYNSVVATFCHQLVKLEQPTVHNDSAIKLIYVGELVDKIIDILRQPAAANYIEVPHTITLSVKELLSKLEYFQECYLRNATMPKLEDTGEVYLFNTFRSFVAPGLVYPIKYRKNADERGQFVELVKAETSGQFSFSTTFPNVTRGNHFHTRKIERFSVISGEAVIKLKKFGSSDIHEYRLSGDEPSYVDMPVWYVHNITNVGKELLYTTFWINEFYNFNDPDTYFDKI